jgi:hypothetical protein
MALLLEHGRKKRRPKWSAFNAPRPRRKKSSYHYTLESPLSVSHPDQILTFLEWCQLNRISERTGRRILAGDDGPVVTQLANWRVGITVGNNLHWQRSRARASNNTQPRHRGRQSQERA